MKKEDKKLLINFNKIFKLRKHFKTQSKKFQSVGKIWNTLGRRLKKLREIHPMVGWNLYRDNPSAKISPSALVSEALKTNMRQYREYMEEVQWRELYYGETIPASEKTPRIKGPLAAAVKFIRFKNYNNFLKINILDQLRGVKSMRFFDEIEEDKCKTEWEKEALLMAFAEEITRLNKAGIWGTRRGVAAPRKTSEELRQLIFSAINYDPDECKREHPELYGEGENEAQHLDEED